MGSNYEPLKSKMINSAYTPEQHAAIAEAATKAGQCISAYQRMVMVDHIEGNNSEEVIVERIELLESRMSRVEAKLMTFTDTLAELVTAVNQISTSLKKQKEELNA